MANRYKMVNNKLVQLTDAEEKRRQAEEKAWVDDAPNRRMTELRRQRNILLATPIVTGKLIYYLPFYIC